MSDGWIGRLLPERPVRTVGVVVLDIVPKDLLEAAAADDQQPVQALGAHRPDPTLRMGVGDGGLHRAQQDLGAEHVVKVAGVLRVVVAQQQVQPSFSFAECHQQVAGLPGNPSAGSPAPGRRSAVEPVGARKSVVGAELRLR